IVFHAEFTPMLDKVRDRLPKVRRWYVVSDGNAEPDWATPYEDHVASGADRVEPPWGRSPDDMLFLYTGGTTGMPKGVMWRQEDLFFTGMGGGNPLGDPVEKPEQVAQNALARDPQIVQFPIAPLIHVAAQLAVFIVFNWGDKIVLIT